MGNATFTADVRYDEKGELAFIRTDDAAPNHSATALKEFVLFFAELTGQSIPDWA